MTQITRISHSCIILNPELIWWRGLILHPNLDNRICAKPSVQARYDMISKSGCLVTLLFNPKPNPQVRTDIAAMLLAAFETRRKDIS